MHTEPHRKGIAAVQIAVEQESQVQMVGRLSCLLLFFWLLVRRAQFLPGVLKVCHIRWQYYNFRFDASQL